MEIADRAECLRRGLHRVAADRAVHMKIDKTGREIISTKIDNTICRSFCLLPDLRNFPLLDHDLQAFANSIWENEARVCENHAANVQRSTPNVQQSMAYGN